MRFFKRLSILLLLSGLLSSCSLLESKPKNEIKEPESRLFYASFERVWRAAQLAMSRYPMRINNVDTGTLETDYIKGARVWRAPDEKKRPPSGMRYIIRVQVLRGQTASKEAIKVVIDKRIEVKKNFFIDPKIKASDGLEERMLLYRINRELKIEKALERAARNS